MDKEGVGGVCVCVCMCIYICMYIYMYVYIYIYNGILLSHKKNKIMPFAATRMDLESVILNEVTQTKEKYHDISYMWDLKRNSTNELTYKTETHRLKT